MYVVISCGVRDAYEPFQHFSFYRRLPLIEGHNRVPSSCFPEHCLDIRQRVTVTEVRKAVRADDGIELFLSAVLSVRILTHREGKDN